MFQKQSSRGVLFKKVFLEISPNSQENTYASVSFLIKLPACCNFLKKRLWHRCFPVNFVKFLRTPFFYRTPLVGGSSVCFSLCLTKLYTSVISWCYLLGFIHRITRVLRMYKYLLKVSSFFSGNICSLYRIETIQ